MHDSLSIPGRRLIVGLLVLAHVVASSGLSAAFDLNSGDEHYTWLPASALLSGQLCLLVVGGMLGQANAAIRIGCTLAGVLLAASISDRAGIVFFDWPVVFLGATIVFAAALRIGRFQLQTSSGDAIQRRGRFLSLGDLFELTTWIAIAAAACARMPAEMLRFSPDTMVYAGIAAQGVAALYFGLGAAALAVRTIAFSVVLLAAFGIAELSIPGDLSGYLVSSVVQISAVLASALVLRVCGYRLARVNSA